MKYGVHSYIFTDHWSDDSLWVSERSHGTWAGRSSRFPWAMTLCTRRSSPAGALQSFHWTFRWDPAGSGLWNATCRRTIRTIASWGWPGISGRWTSPPSWGRWPTAAPLYGHPGTVKRRLPPVDELPRTAEMLHLLAAHAKSRGVLIVLEPMSHFRTHLVNTPEQAMRLLGLADHDNLMLLLDTYHLITEVRDFAAAIRCALPRLWGIHACENDRGVPGGGLVPWDDVFGALGAGGFDGYIVLETYNSSLGDFARRRGIFLDVCPDGPEFVRQGLQFLRAQVAKDADARHGQSSPTESR